MTDKEFYRQFTEEASIYIPIFSKAWWLDAVAGDDWDVLIAKSSSELLAVNPYFYVQHENGKEIRKAILTQNNGVLFNYPDNIKYVKKLAFERKALQMIIDRIEELNLYSYRQYFHYSFTNWLPFYWNGFSQTTRYTYVIEPATMDTIIQNMDSKLRNQIKKAEKIVNVYEGMDIERFYEFNKKTYERQEIDIPYSIDIVRKIDDACRKRESSKILYAIDNNGNIHSAIYLIEDEQSVYYLLSGSAPECRESQSLSLLLLKGIEYAVLKGKKFDFEGSMKRNIEKNFSQFGGIQKPYMDIQKIYK